MSKERNISPIRLLLFLMSIFLSFVTLGQRTPNQRKVDSFRAILQHSDNDTQNVNTMLVLSTILDCNDSNQKISYAKQALILSEKIKWESGIANSYEKLGDVYEYCLKNYVEAIKTYQQLENISSNNNDRKTQNKSLLELAILNRNLGHYDLALYYYRKITISGIDDESAIGINANIGEIYRMMGDYSSALKSYEKALKLLQNVMLLDKNASQKYLPTQAGLLLTIAEIYISTGDYDKAVSNYLKALNNNKQAYFDPVECDADRGLGQSYFLKKDFQKSIKYFERALEITKKAKTQGIDGYEEAILDEIANAYLQIGNSVTALSNARQSLQIAVKNDNKPQQAKTLSTLGRIYNNKKEYKTAVQLLKEAQTIARVTGAKDDEKTAWEVLSESYSGLKQSNKAFAAYKNFIALRDTVYNAEKAKELTRMDMQGEFDRKKYEDSLKKEDERKIVGLRIQKQRVLIYSGFGGVALMVLLAFFVYRNYYNEKKANAVISKANETIKEEQQVSENLLLNILPAHVAEELKAHGDVQAKQFDNVTVLFTDFVSFTSASERLTPQELVAELHACFKAFDGIVGKYNVEKIKTVGDAYLAVSGLPELNANHATNMINAAMEIRDFMVDRKKQLGHLTFGIRLGLNSGSVVAGIVGVKKFAYDIWGDTVNTAARMEQNSEDGKINITEATYELVKDKFLCSYRGEIAAKNKGKLKMYFVEGGLI